MNRKDLTKHQEKVATAEGPVTLVLGGPGTGKTTTALWAAKEALEKPGVAPWQKVLFLTFSRTAVSQIARRAPGVFSGGPDRIEISTFHGFAWRLIRAFGRYGGHGSKLPALQSEARAKLLGRDASRLTYDDLIPAARRLLKSQRIGQLIASRWPLVICDEFQDTNDEQWVLLSFLRKGARLLLLADPNQMIYSFLAKQGVGPQRIKEALKLASDVIELEPFSHRDPSGVIVRMAEAVQSRQFEHDSVITAIRTGRLKVLSGIDDDKLSGVISDQVGRLRGEGARSIGIFGHSNEGVATLGVALADSGLEHVLIGIPEAQAEAFAALATMCAFAVGLATSKDLRLGLATYLTSCTRGKNPPPLAVALAYGSPLPVVVSQRVRTLESRLREAADGTLEDLLGVARDGWKAIGITSGVRPWRRAYPEIMTIARPFSGFPASKENVHRLITASDSRRPNALVEFDSTKWGPIQLMNFHQTKGREADAVLLVYRSEDYLADHTAHEPFEEASRVLFVSLTRARQKVVVVLPEDPHPLIAPFATLAGKI